MSSSCGALHMKRKGTGEYLRGLPWANPALPRVAFAVDYAHKGRHCVNLLLWAPASFLYALHFWHKRLLLLLTHDAIEQAVPCLNMEGLSKLSEHLRIITCSEVPDNHGVNWRRRAFFTLSMCDPVNGPRGLIC